LPQHMKLRRLCLTLQREGELLDREFLLVGRDEAAVIASKDLLTRTARQCDQLLVEPDEAPVRRDRENGIVRVLDQLDEKAALLAGDSFGGSHFGEVSNHA